MNLDQNKIKIFLNHSPIYFNNNDVLKYISEFDFIFCGHMHNGLVPIGIDKLIKNDIGIVSPNRKIFPDNARGLKKVGNNQYLLISSGITKITDHYKVLRIFNKFYPMDIDDIKILKKNKTK